MADKIPVKAILTAGNTSALGEFNPGDTLGVTFGGTGADNAASARTNLGLGNVNNTSDLDKPVSTAQAAADTAVLNAAALDATTKANAAEADAIAASTPIAHISDFNNPHSVTKAQVGLENVDNTSDLNKPVSIAQASAISSAANTAESNAKAASTPIAHVGTTGTSHGAATTSVNGFMSAADKIKLDAISGTNTGDQTNITGNAGTATKLQTARNINGVSFDGSADITVADSTKAVKGANSDITSLSGLTTALTVTQGGTGRNTGTTAYGLIAAGTTAAGAQQTLAAGLTTQILVGGGASALPVWTATTGSGAPVRATSPTLVTPKIGVATGTSFNSITGLSSTTPTMNGVAAVGTGTTTARGDHVHPTDTSRAPIASPSFTGTLTHSGDVVLSGSGKRITGDFSNSTIANRVMFQTNIPSGTTSVCVIPAVGADTSNINLFSNSDPLSSDSQLQLISTVTETSIRNISPKGAGYYTPMTFYTGGAERVRIDTSGNVTLKAAGSATTTHSFTYDENGGQITLADNTGAMYTLFDASVSGCSSRLLHVASTGDLNVGIGAANTTGCIRLMGAGYVERMCIDSSGNVLVTSPAGLGYGTGAGGTVTQATNKTTAVTLNKPCGRITTHTDALAAGASVLFTVNNTVFGENDLLILSPVGSINYRVEPAFSGLGQFGIRLTNLSAGSLSDAVVINFAIIKGALY